MKIEVNGTEYANFVSASVVIRLDTLSNTFAFEATSEDAKPLPFKGGESCTVTVDGELVLTGFIEIVNVDGDAESHTISIEGRDKTADIVDSAIDVLSDTRPPISLKTLIERVITHVGAKISVIDLAKPAEFNAAEDLFAQEPGQNAFEFIEAPARKRQVLLTSDEKGNLVITASSGKEIAATIQHRVADDTSNVLRYSVSYDLTGRFRKYLSSSQLNIIPLNLAGIASNDEIVSQGTENVVTDSDVREGRQLILASESMFSSSQGEDRATWEANIRKARSRVYSATMHGYRNQTGDLWRVNTLVKVNDEYADIEATMLINSTTFSLSEQDGRTTVLSLVERNAYTLELEEPTTEKVGSGFVLP